MSSSLERYLRCSQREFKISEVYALSDSTVTLHWMKDNRKYKAFVCNRVPNIKEKSFINWKYVPTKQNPADIGSRGCDRGKLRQNCWENSAWLRDPNSWPDQPINESSEELEI